MASNKINNKIVNNSVSKAEEKAENNHSPPFPIDEKIATDHDKNLLNEKKLEDFKTNPVGLFHQWFQHAFQFGVPEPFIMSLATSSLKGMPSVRPVALCNTDAKGFYFSTNKNSNKAKDLKENPRASACFYWVKLDRVVRFDGDVIEVNDDAVCFHKWPRSSQISEHSKYVVGQPLDDRQRLIDEKEELIAKFADMEVIPQPDLIQAYCIVPTRFEFVQIHADAPIDRIEFSRNSSKESWKCVRLAR